MIEPERTHPLYCPFHRLWAQWPLQVIVFLSYGLWEDHVARVAVCSGVGRAGTASHVDRVVPV